MEIAVITLIALACTIIMSVLAFMVGRCARKLPIDGMLPRVVRSAQFSLGEDGPHAALKPAKSDRAYDV